MKHLNDDLLCVVDCETTGLTPGFHDLIQICILPLNNMLEPLQKWGKRDVFPFYTDIKPLRPENVDTKAMEVNRNTLSDIMLRGMDAFDAVDKLEEWIAAFNLPFRKRIIPIGHNYVFDRGFIQEWLGPETYSQFFSHNIRDTMSTALFLNDVSSFKVDKCPFPKVNMAYLCSQLNIPHDRTHDALADCLLTAQVYKRMVLGNY